MLSQTAEFPLLIANLDSFVLDWVVRQKLGGLNLTFFVASQLAALPPSAFRERVKWASVSLAEWTRSYLSELVYTTEDMRPFGRDLGWIGRPFVWQAERRSHLRAELDAAMFLLYGLALDEVEHVMDSFWIVHNRDEEEFGAFRTKELILDSFDAMARATPDRPFVSRLDPPPSDPRIAHPPRPGEKPGRWIPWFEVVNRPVTRREASPRHARPGAPIPGQRPASEARPLDPSVQPTLTAGPALGSRVVQWRPEASVESRDIVMGLRIRHRSHGVGTVLSVKPSGTGAELLVRFDVGDEKWIVFGYGVLEFDESP
jgi:hypothetical protein